MRRRDFLRLSLAGAVGAAATACARRRPLLPESVPAALRSTVARLAAGGASEGLMVFPGGQEFVAGRTLRFTLGLVDPGGFSIEGGQATVWVSHEDGQPGQPTQAIYKAYRRVVEDDDPRGFHATTVDMPGPGFVDVLVSIEHRGARLYGWATVNARTGPHVLDVGARAVPVETPTFDDPRGVENVCTRIPPCDLHDRTLADALAGSEAVVYTVASPLLCLSRTCGPVLDEVLAVRDRAGGSVVAAHAEPYEGNSPTILSPAALAWRLESEPWTFVVDPGGIVRARFEGPVVAEEIEAALEEIAS